MKILALSGWGQPHDSLYDILPHATHFDYADYKSVESALEAIADIAQNNDVIVGWSLGGQLAVRGIASGLIAPKKLVLIGVPFQFVHVENIKIGMPKIGMPYDTFQKFRDNYDRNAARTLAKAWELVVLNDKNAENIRARLARHDREKMLEKDWLGWLDRLNGFSCKELDFSNFPETLLFHGANDAVVDSAQIHEFVNAIPQANHVILPDAGHAPHWHNADLVKRHIEDFLYV